MAKDECKVEDMLMTLRERNEQYHDIKERVVWLAGTVYFGFSLLVVKAHHLHEQMPQYRYTEAGGCEWFMLYNPDQDTVSVVLAAVMREELRGFSYSVKRDPGRKRGLCAEKAIEWVLRLSQRYKKGFVDKTR